MVLPLTSFELSPFSNTKFKVNFNITPMNNQQTDYKQKCHEIYYKDAINAYSKPTLASWLALILSNPKGEVNKIYSTQDLISVKGIHFNLTTEEPTDWQALYQIIK